MGTPMSPRVHVPQPEPGLAPGTAVERARALIPLLRAQQAEADARGCYSDEVHQALDRGGLYRVLQPRMFGGYEFDVPSFLRVVMELGRGHPAAAWCYALTSAHCILVGAHLPEAVQQEIFGPRGDFRSPHRSIPAGTWRRVDGGYVVTGRWPYSSGIPVATHFIGGGLIQDPGQPPRGINFIVARNQLTIAPDWGNGASLGLEASGSNTVVLEEAFIPDRHLFREDVVLSSDGFGPADGQGAKLHDNGMYLGVVGGFFPTMFGAIFAGAARAALDEYEDKARVTSPFGRPGVVRIDDADSQAPFGRAATLTDCAEALTLSVGGLFMEVCDQAYRSGTPVTVAQSVRLWTMARQATLMACEAIELLFTSSPVRAANRGERMQRYLRDVQMYRIHPAAQPWLDEVRARAEWGQPLQRLGR